MTGKVRGGPRPKHVPVRTCVACRKSDAKRELVRIVRTPEGKIQVDSGAKLSGRGAYLCRSRACWMAAARSKALERALKSPFDREVVLSMEQFASTLPE